MTMPKTMTRSRPVTRDSSGAQRDRDVGSEEALLVARPPVAHGLGHAWGEPPASPPSARFASSSAWRSDSISLTRLSTSSPSPEIADALPLTESSTARATSSSRRASRRRRRSRASVEHGLHARRGGQLRDQRLAGGGGVRAGRLLVEPVQLGLRAAHVERLQPPVHVVAAAGHLPDLVDALLQPGADVGQVDAQRAVGRRLDASGRSGPGPTASSGRSAATAPAARTGRSARRASPRGIAAATRPPQATAARPIAAGMPSPVTRPTAAPTPARTIPSGDVMALATGGVKNRSRNEVAISRGTLFAGVRRQGH